MRGTWKESNCGKLPMWLTTVEAAFSFSRLKELAAYGVHPAHLLISLKSAGSSFPHLS
jgi:hypothetical protein